MGQNIFARPCIIRETSSGYDRIAIDEELMQSRELFMTDFVSSDSMSTLFMQLLYLYRTDPEKEITIYINSPGGEVRSGLAVFDLLRMIRTPVRTVCIGTAASMGALLFLAGDKREMMPSSELMIHDPSTSNDPVNGLKPAEIEEKLNQLKKVRSLLAGIIAERTGKSEEEILEITCKDSYFDSDEALAFGLATSIVSNI